MEVLPPDSPLRQLYPEDTYPNGVWDTFLLLDRHFHVASA